MDKQIQIIKTSEGNKYFERNKIYEYDFDFKKINNLIKSSNLKANSILEIGSANGGANVYDKLLNQRSFCRGVVKKGNKRW